VDSTVDFYTRVNALLSPEMIVLDFGAGRGRGSEGPSSYVRTLATLKGKVQKVVGADVDPVVRDNPLIDDAVVIAPDSPLPFADRSIDLIVSDWTFEHIQNPNIVVRELGRVLRPGGWICARTPNRWGYITIGAQLVPERLHAAVLRKAQPDRKQCDVFPKFYKLNSHRAIKRIFHGFDVFLYTVNSEPAYFGNSRLLWRAALLGFRITPSRFGAIIHAFLRKNNDYSG
jgi:SAM-dependent methyltransferase